MLQVGTIGTGKIAEQMLEAISMVDGIECTAVYSRSVEKGAMFARFHNIPFSYSSMEKMFESGKINTAYIATPNSLHYQQCIKAINYGLNVICEKPLTTTKAEAEAIFKLAEERNVFVFEGISTLYMPNYIKCIEIAQGIKPLTRITCSYTQRSHRYNAYLRGEQVNAFDTQMQGGALNDLGIYAIHAIINLMGMPSKVSYFPILGRNSIDLSGMLTLQYSTMRVEIFCAKNCDKGSNFLIQGSGAAIRVDGPLNEFKQCSLDSAGHSQPFQFQDSPNRLTYELKAFINAINSNDREFFRKAANQSTMAATVLELAHANSH